MSRIPFSGAPMTKFSSEAAMAMTVGSAIGSQDFNLPVIPFGCQIQNWTSGHRVKSLLL